MPPCAHFKLLAFQVLVLAVNAAWSFKIDENLLFYHTSSCLPPVVLGILLGVLLIVAPLTICLSCFTNGKKPDEISDIGSQVCDPMTIDVKMPSASCTSQEDPGCANAPEISTYSNPITFPSNDKTQDLSYIDLDSPRSSKTKQEVSYENLHNLRASNVTQDATYENLGDLRSSNVTQDATYKDLDDLPLSTTTIINDALQGLDDRTLEATYVNLDDLRSSNTMVIIDDGDIGGRGGDGDDDDLEDKTQVSYANLDDFRSSSTVILDEVDQEGDDNRAAIKRVRFANWPVVTSDEPIPNQHTAKNASLEDPYPIMEPEDRIRLSEKRRNLANQTWKAFDNDAFADETMPTSRTFMCG
uniref:Protein JASON n=1 Tax=Mesocestoides corti TaxID=53468 RepID=A0A5K3FH07_MESCO